MKEQIHQYNVPIQTESTVFQKEKINGKFSQQATSKIRNQKEAAIFDGVDIPMLRQETHKRFRRNSNLRFGRAVRWVPDNLVNSDGSFQLDEIAQTDYFIAHPEQLVLLKDRKLSEKSNKETTCMCTRSNTITFT